MIPNEPSQCEKKPCKDFPFRKDSLKGWLSKDRMIEILSQESFVCHKENSLQCAGYMLIKGDKNVFVAVAGRMNIELNLPGIDLVFQDQQLALITTPRYPFPVFEISCRLSAF